MATVTVKAQCLCRAQTFTAAVPLSSLPLPASSCHCTSCRRITGGLRSSDAPWPGPGDEVVRKASAFSSAAAAAAAGSGTATSLAGGGGGGGGGEGSSEPVPLRRYRHSPKVDLLFCGDCGSGMFWEEFEHARPPPAEHGSGAGSGGGGDAEGAGEGRGELLVFTSVLSADGARAVDAERLRTLRLVRWDDHVFVGDTRDGGSLCWLRKMNRPPTSANADGDWDGEPVKVWLGRRNESEEVKAGVHWPALRDLPDHGVNLKAAQGKEGNVPIRCHCGGVDLVLRAAEAQRECERKQRDGEEIPFFVDPVTHKLLGALDACDSCRIWGGSDIFTWTFALLRHISFADADPDAFPRDTSQLRAAVEAGDGRPRDARLGTLAFYASSPDVQRYFCGRCSASVFYAVDDRPDMVDVALGVLDAPDGARAESVISWSFGGGMNWRQDAIGTWREGLLHAVEEEAERWRIERGYPKGWRRVVREQAEQAAKAE